MVSFTSDYIAGAHPKVLEHLMQTNLEVLSGYGSDTYTEIAKKKILKRAGCPDGDVYFLVGGTQTNQIVISTMLKPYEGVISAHSGHINAHEAGAVEFTGNKVLPLKGEAGKLNAQDVKEYVKTFYEDENHEHMVFPGMVYISFPTEYGTLYSKAELTALYDVCKEYNMTLFVDGARLGYGLASKENDVTIEDLAKLSDFFYIGGTKVGALCGEAVVFPKGNAPKHFVNQIKQRGGLLAKGRLLGVQFDALFTNNLYFEIGKHAMELAYELKTLFKEKGYPLFLDSPTNQQFVILENEKMKELSQSVSFGFWEKYDDTHTVVRFATSWSTTKEDINTLRELL